ncbi:type 4a pilus biogenesis protein PilO [Patescibacteria group bacterium]|nr:type 4a pilus biogenesis protein PilO [Patescibacteria group bacterium]
MPNEKVKISADAPVQKEQKQIQKKRPSRLFTHYYGSIILLLISVLIAAGFLIIKPKIDAYKNIHSQILSTQNNIDAERQYYDGLSRSVAAANTIDSEVLDKVDRALPREISIPEMLVQVEQASKSNGVSVSSISFEQTTTKKNENGLQPVGMTMAVKAGSYQQLKSFLNSLETSLRIMDLQLLSVAQFDEKGVSFTLQMQTYYYPTASNL